MTPFTLAALIFSIIAIVLWIVTFTQSRSRRDIKAAPEEKPSEPDLTVLVLDAMIGQDAVYQAETFMKETSFDCVVLTKLDTDARGGAIITIADQLRKPVLFLGVGQGMDDIMEFSTEWYLDRVLPN